MKNITLILILFLSIFSKTIFAEFDASIYAPLSLSITFPIIEAKNNSVNNLKGNNNFSAGVIANFGHKFIINDGKYSISLLTEFGYYRQAFSASAYLNNIEFKDNVKLDSLLIGILPKFNIDLKSFLNSINPDYNTKTILSIGIGFGVKIALGGEIGSSIDNQSINQKMSFSDINKKFNYPLTPYIKLQLEDHFYFNEYIAFLFGITISYDFGIFYDMNYIDSMFGAPIFSSVINKYGFSAFEIAINLGMKFGR